MGLFMFVTFKIKTKIKDSKGLDGLINLREEIFYKDFTNYTFLKLNQSH